ncbi:MAG: insulinase family protein [Candidatus Gastranaerophilales bacterium]|nr:insulinase family protein [Candidatus Gastranaerophilales bacterium]
MEITKHEEIIYPYLENPLDIYTFDNGYKAVLAYKKSPIINISSWVKTGSINENSQNNGVSHFVEHLLFKGTNKYPAGVFDKTMEQLGGIINAATWKDYTFYYINIPKEHYKIALEMHGDMIVDAIFPKEEIGSAFNPEGKAPEDKRERYVVIEEIKMGEDNNWRKVYKSLNNVMYEKHPYKREVIGTKEIIANISQEEIMRYYKTFYTPENITTIVAGDFDKNEMINLIKENFKFKKSNLEPSKPDERIIETRIKNPQTIINYSEVNTGYLMIGALCDSAKNLKETIALDLLSTILGDGKSSRLYSALIEKPDEPYYYQIESCHYQFRDGDNFFIEANFDADKKDIVIDELKGYLKNLEHINEDEFNKAKKRAKVNFVQDSEMVADIADSIGYWMSVCDDITLANKYLDTLDKIDCNYLEEIARKYLNPEYVSASMILPKLSEEKK